MSMINTEMLPIVFHVNLMFDVDSQLEDQRNYFQSKLGRVEEDSGRQVKPFSTMSSLSIKELFF